MTAGLRIGGFVLSLVLALAGCGRSEPAETTTTDDQGGPTASTTETREAPGPLMLVIDDPVNGQVVEEDRYVFRGRATPGAIVLAAGDIVVPVDEDGSWQIELRLQPGSNVATIVAEDATGQRVVGQVQVIFRDDDLPTPFSP